ncbi:MAG: type II toxin-antitoxin system RelE/ParE family toxin [Geitlerinemataceae cyanobacterium]
MQVKLRKEAQKFLKKLDKPTRDRVLERIGQLRSSLIAQEIPQGLDIKALQGNWQGFSRLRVGQIRVIYRIEAGDVEILFIYDINYRGSVY